MQKMVKDGITSTWKLQISIYIEIKFINIFNFILFIIFIFCLMDLF